MGAHAMAGDMKKWCEKEGVRRNVVSEAQNAMQRRVRERSTSCKCKYKQWLFMQQQVIEKEMKGKYLWHDDA